MSAEAGPPSRRHPANFRAAALPCPRALPPGTPPGRHSRDAPLLAGSAPSPECQALSLSPPSPGSGFARKRARGARVLLPVADVVYRAKATLRQEDVQVATARLPTTNASLRQLPLSRTLGTCWASRMCVSRSETTAKALCATQGSADTAEAYGNWNKKQTEFKPPVYTKTEVRRPPDGSPPADQAKVPGGAATLAQRRRGVVKRPATSVTTSQSGSGGRGPTPKAQRRRIQDAARAMRAIGWPRIRILRSHVGCRRASHPGARPLQDVYPDESLQTGRLRRHASRASSAGPSFSPPWTRRTATEGCSVHCACCLCAASHVLPPSRSAKHREGATRAARCQEALHAPCARPPSSLQCGPARQRDSVPHPAPCA